MPNLKSLTTFSRVLADRDSKPGSVERFSRVVNGNVVDHLAIRAGHTGQLIEKSKQLSKFIFL